MQQIYFDYDELDKFVEWLETEPSGSWRVMVGNAIDSDLVWIVGSIAEMGHWPLAERLVARLNAGEMTIEATQEALANPIGVALN